MSDPFEHVAHALAGHYAIESELGRGGMAAVYLAEERKHGRKVAIKVLRPDLLSSVGAERFLREIGIAARLSHPHIVPLIDSGSADGLLYYVSPHVTGGSLRDRLSRDGRLGVADALRIAHEISTALDYAHRNGFVHRDVKPENILFAEGHALLADFGIAHACCAPGVETLTEGGLAVGTPAYMSPEQASGEVNLGSVSDVYSLACVVFEMLAGEPPFSGPSAQAIMARQVTETPRALRLLRPDAPPAVERALARALAKRPDDRYASVVDFVLACRDGTGDRMPTVPAASRSIAVLPFVNSSPDPNNEYLSDGITDELIDAFAKVDGLLVASRSSVYALKGKAQDTRAIGTLLGASVLLEGSVRQSGERLRITAQLTSADSGRLLWSQRFDRRLDDVFAIQEEIARTIVSTLRATTLADPADLAAPPARRHTQNVRAFELYLKGRYAWNQRTQQGVGEGIRYFEQAIAEDPGYALAYTGLADAWALHVDYRNVPVFEGFERAKTYARKAIALDDSLAEGHASLGWCLFIHDFDWKGAEAEFRRATELDPRYATARQWYSFLLFSQGRVEEGLMEARIAQELDAGSVSIRRSRGFGCIYARRYDEAARHLTRAIAMNPIADETYRTLGLALTLGGEFAEAERVLRQAVTMDSAGTYGRTLLAYSLARAGDRSFAGEVLRDLVERRERDYVSPVEFAMLSLALGDLDAAMDWTERAFEERRGWVTYVRVHPVMDPLRGTPRFEALAERLGL